VCERGGNAADLSAVFAITAMPASPASHSTPPLPFVRLLDAPILGISALVMVSGGECQANWVDLDLPARRRL